MVAVARNFEKETELVAAFSAAMERERAKDWTLYHETAGFDVLAVHRYGYQVGIEAKLSVNIDVILQALPHSEYDETIGPDYRAILVPEQRAFTPNKLGRLCPRLGLQILTVYDLNAGWSEPRWALSGWGLPDEGRGYYSTMQWWNWCPSQRCSLPEYVPDVRGGDSAPVTLTPWKIKAIKLHIVLERQGYVTRSDMKALEISPSRWTDRSHGFLAPNGEGKYVTGPRTPNFRAQHPINYAEIEADRSVWGKALAGGAECPGWLA